MEDIDGETKVEETKHRWQVSRSSSKILVEVATAYAITKVFLPARILLSVWATPWFARVFIGKVGGGIRRYFGKGGIAKGSTAAGTGATGAGVIGKSPGKGS